MEPVVVNAGAHLYTGSEPCCAFDKKSKEYLGGGAYQGSITSCRIELVCSKVKKRTYGSSGCLSTWALLVVLVLLVGTATSSSVTETQHSNDNSILVPPKLHVLDFVKQGSLLNGKAPNKILTNTRHFQDEGYLFPVNYNDVYDPKKIFFKCQVVPSFIGVAEPLLDPITGNVYCKLLPYSPAQLVEKAPEDFDLSRVWNIHMKCSLLEDDSISAAASAFFLGGFSLYGRDEYSRMQLKLFLTHKMRYVTVVGNTNVSITWQHPEKLFVIEYKSWNQQIYGYAVYEVKAKRFVATFNDKITISLPDLEQEMVLDVSYDDMTIPCESFYIVCYFKYGRDAPYFPLILHLLVFVVMLVIRLVMVVFYPRPTPQVPTPTTSAISSSRIPQEFLDHVRSTIDDTPYYHTLRKRAVKNM